MSTNKQPLNGDSPSESDENWIEANREQIEREAESGAPDAWVFERLLQSSPEADST